MAHKVRGHEPHPGRLSHATQWLDDKLVPALGPPPLGPYDVESPHSTLCPLCGEALITHRVERQDRHTYLHCADGTVTETGRPG